MWYTAMNPMDPFVIQLKAVPPIQIWQILNMARNPMLGNHSWKEMRPTYLVLDFPIFWNGGSLIESRYGTKRPLYLSPLSQSLGPHLQAAKFMMLPKTEWMNLNLRPTQFRTSAPIVEKLFNLVGTPA